MKVQNTDNTAAEATGVPQFFAWIVSRIQSTSKFRRIRQIWTLSGIAIAPRTAEIPIWTVKIRQMRSPALFLALAILSGCAPDDPTSATPGGWRKIQSFEPAVQIPQDGALRLEYGVTGGAAVFDTDGDGDLDIVLTGTGIGSPTRLWEQTEPLVFVDATVGSGFDPTFFGIGASAGGEADGE